MVIYYQSFLSQFKGIKGLIDNGLSETEQLFIKIELGEEEEEIYKNYIIELREVNGSNIVAILNNHFVFYLLTKTDIFNLKLYLTFTFNNQYSSGIFQGIIPDSGAASISIAKKPRFIAL